MTVNQNVPTHIFGGGIATASNTFPSDAPADTTYGGIVPSHLFLLSDDPTQSISGTDPLVAFVTPTGGTNIVLTVPNASESQNGRVYTFYVGGSGNGVTASGTVIVRDAAGTAIPGTVTTTTAKAAIITIVYYDDGATSPTYYVRGSTVISA